MEHYCEAYPQNSVEENPLLPGDDQYFNIKVECENLHLSMSDDVDEEAYCYTIDHAVTNIPIEALVQETSMMLSHLGVPEDAQDFMAEKILACADIMANITHKNHKILNINVFMSITRVNEDEVVEESMEDHRHCLVPASKSAIDRLERVKVAQEEKCDCAVCLEDFGVDSEAVRLPCLHLFHKNCIVNWLQKGHSCPLCRYQMPTSESE